MNCDDCGRIVKFKGWMVCDCSCGEHAANGAHPLSPCEKKMCVFMDENGRIYDDQEQGEFEGYPECDVDEDAIFEGHRCIQYCGWLHAMSEYLQSLGLVFDYNLKKYVKKGDSE